VVLLYRLNTVDNTVQKNFIGSRDYNFHDIQQQTNESDAEAYDKL
jgi:hypothetical protein